MNPSATSLAQIAKANRNTARLLQQYAYQCHVEAIKAGWRATQAHKDACAAEAAAAAAAAAVVSDVFETRPLYHELQSLSPPAPPPSPRTCFLPYDGGVANEPTELTAGEQAAGELLAALPLPTNFDKPQESKTLQDQWKRASPIEKKTFISAVPADVLIALSKDRYGFYLMCLMVQERATHEAFVDALNGKVIEMSMHNQGSLVMRQLYDSMLPEKANDLVQEYAGSVAHTASTQPGMIAIDVAYKKTHARFVFEEVADKITVLSMSYLGAKAIQGILEEAVKTDADIDYFFRQVLNMANETFVEMATHKHANYVVQQWMYLANPTTITKTNYNTYKRLAFVVIEKVRQHAKRLCDSFYGSFVVDSMYRVASVYGKNPVLP
tara:strand:+ start:26 stop:1171 length:1146 start_codon:yes stop_codon:yes gene_type:complete